MKGNSTNFVGFSEFLVLRSLLHQLDADRYSKPKTPDVGVFTSKRFKGLMVGTECIPEPARSLRPDIVLYYENPTAVKGIIEVKAYPTSGNTTINRTIEKLQMSQKYHKNLRALILVFWRCRERLNGLYKVRSLWEKSNTLIPQ